jgi:hypothetical protein
MAIDDTASPRNACLARERGGCRRVELAVETACASRSSGGMKQAEGSLRERVRCSSPTGRFIRA